jgi:hypothetical protein
LNSPAQEIPFMPVTVTIDTPANHEAIPAGAMFEANGKVMPETAIVSAKIRHADNAETRGMQVPANAGYDWTFRFDGIPTGPLVTLLVHAFDLEAADGAEASRTFRLVDDDRRNDGPSLAPESAALATFTATSAVPEGILEAPTGPATEDLATLPVETPPLGETPPPAEVTPPVFPTAPTAFPVVPPSIIVDAELVVTSEPPATTAAESTSPRKRSRPAARIKAQMPKKTAKPPARKAGKGPARKTVKQGLGKKAAAKKAKPTAARKEARGTARKTTKAAARKEEKITLKKAAKTSPKKARKAKASKPAPAAARRATMTPAKKGTKAAAKTHPKRRTSR